MHSAEWVKQSPSKKVPVLLLDDGKTISGLYAIIRYLCRLTPENPLLGTTKFEEAEVDMWLDTMFGEFNPSWKGFWMILGVVKYEKNAYEAGEKLLDQCLKLHNNHLKTRTFMVGYQITIADITLANILVPLYRYYLDEGKRKRYVHLTRYFDFMRNQEEFKKVVGRVWLCEQQLKPIQMK